MIEVDELIVKTLKPLKYPVFKFKAITKEPTYIVFYIWNESEMFHAGDKPFGEATRATVNIYSDDENKKLVKAVKLKLRKAGFSIIGSHSVFNDETDRIQNIIEILYEDL